MCDAYLVDIIQCLMHELVHNGDAKAGCIL